MSRNCDTLAGKVEDGTVEHVAFAVNSSNASGVAVEVDADELNAGALLNLDVALTHAKRLALVEAVETDARNIVQHEDSSVASDFATAHLQYVVADVFQNIRTADGAGNGVFAGCFILVDDGRASRNDADFLQAGRRSA